MTKYLVERRFHVGEDEMPAVGRRSRELIEENFPQITWHHSHVVVDEGGNVRTYCVYEAPTEEVVRSHADSRGLPAELRPGSTPARCAALREHLAHVKHRRKGDGLPFRDLAS